MWFIYWFPKFSSVPTLTLWWMKGISKSWWWWSQTALFPLTYLYIMYFGLIGVYYCQRQIGACALVQSKTTSMWAWYIWHNKFVVNLAQQRCGELVCYTAWGNMFCCKDPEISFYWNYIFCVSCSLTNELQPLQSCSLSGWNGAWSV